MRFGNLFAAALLPVGTVLGEGEFVSELVNDVKAHKSDYINYFLTVKSVPSKVQELAEEANTHKGSFQSLYNSEDVADLTSYAKKLPWHTRFEQADASGSSTSSSDSNSDSSTASGDAGKLAVSAGGSLLVLLAALV